MSEEHFRSLGKIAEWAHRSGHTILRGINDNQGNQTIRGYQVKLGNNPIYIESTAEQPYFTAKTVWSYSNLLSANIPEDRIDRQIEQMEENEYSNREEVRELIAHLQIRKNADWVQEQTTNLEENLLKYNSRIQYSNIPGEGSEEIGDGFWVVQTLYPRDEDFNHGKYDEAIRTVNTEQTRIGRSLLEGAEEQFSLLSEGTSNVESGQEATDKTPNMGNGRAYQ